MRLVSTRNLIVATAVGMAVCASPAAAATFTVTTDNDVAAAGSLRWAINAAEQQPGRDAIEFDIAGAGPHTIALAGDLPVISRPVTLDAYTEAGALPATADRPAEPMIVIDATNAFRGLDIGGDRIEIRGLAIHSAQADGIYVEGRDNVIAGNHIGTDAAGGAAALPPLGCGVELYGGGNIIGGPAAADRNVIAGQLIEVCVWGGSGHEIEGNRIGTNADGTAGLGSGYGVEARSSGNVMRDNLISGLAIGVEVTGDDNVLQGNLIGTDVDGASPVANNLGVNVEGGDDNQIGGTAPGEGNVISGNEIGGLHLEGGDADDADVGEEAGPATRNVLEGNLIGLDASGTAPLPNGTVVPISGVLVDGVDHNTIGGEEPGAGNVIAGNDGAGVLISNDAADSNRVIGNLIGTNAAGASLGNSESGVEIHAGDDNTVGAGNVIAHNGEDGVTVDETAVENSIVGNSIFANGDAVDDLGIDLNADGVTANDALDVDAGANALLNHPEITAVTGGAAGLKVHWTMDGPASSAVRLEFFASEDCDDSGSGEGQTSLGTTRVFTDVAGHAAGTTVPAVDAAAGAQISMTATRTGFVGPLPLTPVLHETSEFSPCRPVS